MGLDVCNDAVNTNKKTLTGDCNQVSHLKGINVTFHFKFELYEIIHTQCSSVKFSVITLLYFRLLPANYVHTFHVLNSMFYKDDIWFQMTQDLLTAIKQPLK